MQFYRSAFATGATEHWNIPEFPLSDPGATETSSNALFGKNTVVVMISATGATTNVLVQVRGTSIFTLLHGLRRLYLTLEARSGRTSRTAAKESTMGLIAKNEVGEKGVIPAGTHVARCYGVIDLGTQYSEKFGRWANKIMVQFELPADLTDDGRPAIISKKYTLSLNDKASLRKDLESWLGRPVTASEERDGFALGSMLGAVCLLSILHGENAEKAYAYIAGVKRVPEGMVVPDAVNPVVLYDIEGGEDAVYAKLPDWVKNLIQQSRQFKGDEEPAETKTDE